MHLSQMFPFQRFEFWMQDYFGTSVTQLLIVKGHPWRRLPQRVDLEHQCLTLKLLSIKVLPCSIFSTIWANNTMMEAKKQALYKPINCK